MGVSKYEGIVMHEEYRRRNAGKKHIEKIVVPGGELRDFVESLNLEREQEWSEKGTFMGVPMEFNFDVEMKTMRVI
jgi:hypothetical protein